MLGLKEDPKSTTHDTAVFASRPWLFNRDGVVDVGWAASHIDEEQVSAET